MTNPNHSAQAGIGVQAPERSKIQFSKKFIYKKIKGII